MTTTQQTTWSDRAALAAHAIHATYWDPAGEVYRHVDPFVPHDGPFHYWWQAHALDLLVDAYERDGDARHLDQAARLVAGVRRANLGEIRNDYYDDMLWMALAALRLHDHTRDAAVLADVRTLWTDIRGGWNDFCGGGVAWRKTQLDYKNTPANAPAVILAARLYGRFGDPADLDWARRIMTWLEARLIDAGSGWVYDGLNRLGDGQLDEDWDFTYNPGVVIGAYLELAGATNEPHFTRLATRTAHAAFERLAPRGELPDEGQGDAGLFKGILVRYLVRLALHTGDRAVAALLAANGERLWRSVDAHARFPLAGPDWSAARPASLDLSTALSGAMLLEGLATLARWRPDLLGRPEGA